MNAIFIILHYKEVAMLRDEEGQEWTKIQSIIVGAFGGAVAVYGIVLLIARISGH